VAFFVCPITSNWSWNPVSARTGRHLKCLRNSMAFFRLWRVEMNQEKIITAEDRLRGPMIRCLDEATGITATEFMNAIDLHIIPPLVHAYSDMCELSGSYDNDRDWEEANAHLATIRNAIILLARMEDEVMSDRRQRQDGSQEGRN